MSAVGNLPDVPPFQSRWTKDAIHYQIQRYPAGIAPTDFASIVAATFARWTSCVPKTVTPAGPNDSVDITLTTGDVIHTAGAYDGQEAYTVMPGAGNDSPVSIIFEQTLTWDGAGGLINYICAHEFGHVLGLWHSTIPGTVMYGIYRSYQTIPQFDDDAVKIINIYGARPPYTRTVVNYSGALSAQLDGKVIA